MHRHVLPARALLPSRPGPPAARAQREPGERGDPALWAHLGGKPSDRLRGRGGRPLRETATKGSRCHAYEAPKPAGVHPRGQPRPLCQPIRGFRHGDGKPPERQEPPVDGRLPHRRMGVLPAENRRATGIFPHARPATPRRHRRVRMAGPGEGSRQSRRPGLLGAPCRPGRNHRPERAVRLQRRHAGHLRTAAPPVRDHRDAGELLRGTGRDARPHRRDRRLGAAFGGRPPQVRQAGRLVPP